MQIQEVQHSWVDMCECGGILKRIKWDEDMKGEGRNIVKRVEW